MTRSALKSIVLLLLILAGPLSFWVFLLEPHYSRHQWSLRVQNVLRTLPTKRPADVTPGQWEFMVGWTYNLHANCYSVNQREIWPFLKQLEQRLQGPVNAATIGWIWDEYTRITDWGQRYSDNYRPTRSPDLERAQPGCFGMNFK